MAWRIEPQTALMGAGTSSFTAYYMLDDDYDGYEIVDIPEGYSTIEEPGAKMCVWVR